MNASTWNRFERDFAEFPGLAAKSVPYDLIDESFREYDHPIPSDYREFIHRYGGAIVGAFSIYGIGASEMMGNDEESTMIVTDRFRSQGWVGTDKWLIISIDHSGNPVGLDHQGVVWISDVVHGCIDKLADSFEGYITEWCWGDEEQET